MVYSRNTKRIFFVSFNMIIVLLAIASLLENPNPDDALVASIAETYNKNRPKFNKIAKEYVEKASIQMHCTWSTC